MAKTNSNNSVVFFLSIVAISLLLTVATGKSGGSRQSARSGLLEGPIGPHCEAVHGVKSGETCSDVADAAHMNNDFFKHLNPNLNCNALFVGQWLCISGIP